MPVKTLINISEDKCKICYACVKACPVKALQVVKPDAAPELLNERCIGCGSCIISCSPKAITYRSSLNETNKLLKNKENYCVALVSPSISGEFEDVTDYRKFVQMTRELGFKKVVEVAFGVDVIAHKLLDLINDFKGKYYISSHDPVVVQYVEKYKPNLVGNLAPLVSPTIASGIIAREKYKEKKNLKLIYVGPDIATKDEINRPKNKNIIDTVITFEELRIMFKKLEINENTLEFSDFDPPLAYKGSLFPIANGILQATEIDENLLTTPFITVEGEKQMVRSLDEFEQGIDVIEKHLNVNYGNSLMGPGMSKTGQKLIRQYLVIKYVNQRLTNFFRIEWQDDLDRYYQLNYQAQFKANDQRLPEPTKKQVKEILEGLGKSEHDNVGCEECGYSSCKDFAVAIAQGLTSKEMCSAYALKNNLSHIKSLKNANDELAMAKDLLQKSEQKARKEQEAAKLAGELTNAMLQKLRAGVVIVNKDLKILQSNPKFVEILGDDAKEVNDVIPGLVGADFTKLVPFSLYNLFKYVLENDVNIENRDVQIDKKLLNVSIFVIQKDEVVGGIVRDMSTPEVQKFEVMNRVSDVIDKNLEMVQKIGFLLGDGASEIEKMLNSIIEFYQKENE